MSTKQPSLLTNNIVTPALTIAAAGVQVQANIVGSTAGNVQNNFGMFCDLSAVDATVKKVDLLVTLEAAAVGLAAPATVTCAGVVTLNYKTAAGPGGIVVIDTSVPGTSYYWTGNTGTWTSAPDITSFRINPANNVQSLQIELNGGTVNAGVAAGTLRIQAADNTRDDGPVVASSLFGAAQYGSEENQFAPYLRNGVSQGLQRTGLPLGAVPVGIAALAREDVLGKVYSSSAFFKGCIFQPSVSATENKLSWYRSRPDLSPDATAGLWTSTANGPKFSIPMGLLSHLFRQEQLFPLRNAGQLIMQIQFADPQECCFAAPVVSTRPGAGVSGCSLSGKTSSTGTVTIKSFGIPSATYTVTNLELECDIVTAIPEYTAILDSICSRPADKGLAIAFDSHLSSLQQVTSAAASSPGAALGNGSQQSYTLIASKGSENVRSFHFTLSPTAGLRSFEYLQNSTFPAYDMQQWQLRIGSVYYPAFPSQGLSKNYMEMLSSVNAPMPSVGQASLIDYNMFRASTPTVAWTQASPAIGPADAKVNYEWFSGAFSRLEGTAVSADGVIIPAGVTNLLQIDPHVHAFSDGYIGGYCFDNLKHAEPLSHDGLDTRAIAGGMIQLDFTCRPLEAFAVVFHIRFTRTIVLAENGVSIVG
jgi:hypothetical protein